MRRGLASLIMGLSLVVASASWAGFVLSRTVLDPSRSETLADTLLDNEAVRAVIVDRLADSVEAQIPASVPVSRETIELAAELALEDPRVEALVRDGVVKTHQNALAGVDEPVVLDASAMGQVGREAMVGLRPELDLVLPAAPTLAVELPGSGLSWLGGVKNAVDRFTQLSAAVALIGLITSFVAARNRAAVLRRVAYWAFGASLFWLGIAYGVPAVMEKIAPSSILIAAAIIDIFLGSMVRPALTMAGAGGVLLVLSFVWPALARRRPAAMVNRPAPARGALGQGRPVLEGVVRSAAPAPASRGAGAFVPSYPPTDAVPVVARSQPQHQTGHDNRRFHPNDIGPSTAGDSRLWEPMIPPTPWPDADGSATPPRPDRMRRSGSVGARPVDPETWRVQRSALDQREQPIWVEGVGYVDSKPADDGADYDA